MSFRATILGWLGPAAVVVAAAVLVGSLLYDSDVVFLVEARTEYLGIISEGTVQQLTLDGATTIIAGRAEQFTGYCLIDSGVRVEFERISTGELRISMSGPPASVKLTDVRGDSAQIPAGGLRIVIDNIAASLADLRTTVFNIKGDFRIGKYDTDGNSPVGVPTPLLRSGKVSALGKTLIGNNLVEIRTQELIPGDVFRLVDRERFDDSPGAAVVFCDEGPGVMVAARIAADRGSVTGYGRAGHHVQVPLWYRLGSDRYVQALWIIIPLLGGLWTGSRKFMRKQKEGRCTD